MTTTATLIQALHDAATQETTVAPLSFAGLQAYLDSGDRLTYENQYFARRKQLAVLGLSQYLAPTSAKRALLEEVIWAILNEYTWALPAHLPQTGTTFGEAAPQYLDLFNAETGSALAELKFLLQNQLAPELIQRIDGELERRILTPYAARDWSWMHKTNNWSAVVGGCIGITALYQLPAGPRLTQFINRLDVAMTAYLSSFGADGASVEGVSYWAYGFGYYVYYADLLASRHHDDHLLTSPKVRAIAAFPAAVQLSVQATVPFSDYDPIELPTGLLTYCRQHFGVATPPITAMNTVDFDPCYRFAQLYRNLLWAPDHFDAPAPLAPADHYFPDCQWWVKRDHDLVFAAKGGRNDESHNHIDLGHFVFGTPKHLFLDDLGAGVYTRDYFVEAKRYKYFPPSAAAHALPVIGGFSQQPGPVAAHAHYTKEQLTLDLHETYPQAAKLTAFTRTFSLSKRQFSLHDHIQTRSASSLQECFITRFKPRIASNQVILTAGDETCTLALATTDIQCHTITYLDHQGQAAIAYQIQAAYAPAAVHDLAITGTLS
ncbi:hypothetical protein [Lacticaseibacillus jixiensis]|uniref:hypothetical protein n=1 Tax=Lacticaseibacillus jixiensis TaxID=3231926 RepID=UPI0036F3B30C